jgi:hypothetical protein
MRFPFVQFEFTHSLGPPAGRYVIRSESIEEETAAGGLHPLLGPDPGLLATADVLVIDGEVAAPVWRRLRRPRPTAVTEGERPADVQLFVYTLIKGTRALDGYDDAEAFIANLSRSLAQAEEWAEDALELVNRTIAAYRVCAADAYAVEVSRRHARAVRVGYGTGEKVFRGGWERAVALPAPSEPRIRRELRLMPQQGMADVLSATGQMLEGEELVLRAGLDLAHGRGRAAAVGLLAGVQLLLAELAGVAGEFPGDELCELRARLDELEELTGRVRQEQLLGEADIARLVSLAELAGAAVDGWRYHPTPA